MSVLPSITFIKIENSTDRPLKVFSDYRGNSIMSLQATDDDSEPADVKKLSGISTC